VLTADLLHRLYVTERLSVEATAAQLGYAPHRVRLALDRPTIVARSCPRGNPGLPEKQAAAALRRTPSFSPGRRGAGRQRADRAAPAARRRTPGAARWPAPATPATPGPAAARRALTTQPAVQAALARRRQPSAAVGSPEPACELLRELYFGLGLSAAQIRLLVDLNPAVVIRRPRRAGVPLRSAGGLSPASRCQLP